MFEFSLTTRCCKAKHSESYAPNVDAILVHAGVYDALHNSDGMFASQIHDAIVQGIRLMESDMDGFRALNPPNGWGNADEALDFLKRIARACQKWQTATISTAEIG